MMRATTAALDAAISAGASPRLALTAWRGTQRLADVPVVAGSWALSDNADSKTGGSLRFEVPAEPELIPLDPLHPLAPFGQTLTAAFEIDVRGQTLRLPAGRWRIEDCVVDRDVVSVTAPSLLANIEAARFLGPFTVPTGTTRARILAKICEGIVPLEVQIVDEAIPGGAVWDRERIDALVDVVEGWRARYFMSDAGVLTVASAWPTTGTPVLTWADGPGGVLLDAQPSDSEARGFNAYVVTTQPKGSEPPVSEIAILDSGPMTWGGPYGYRPGFYSSPTLPSDRPTLQAIAKAMLERSRTRLQRLRVSVLPDPRVQVGDVVRVRSSRRGVDVVGRVRAVEHTPGELRATIGVQP